MGADPAEQDAYAAVEGFEHAWLEGEGGDTFYDMSERLTTETSGTSPHDEHAMYEQAWDQLATFWSRRLQRRHGFAYPESHAHTETVQ